MPLTCSASAHGDLGLQIAFAAWELLRLMIEICITQNKDYTVIATVLGPRGNAGFNYIINSRLWGVGFSP